MKIAGEQRIAAARQDVWEALNDADVLRQCIPGCQTLERESAERFKATVAIKIGPIGARFAGAVTLSDVDPSNAYTLTIEGQGGAAGFVKGSAKVRLNDDGDATRLTYDADVQVGGRLAQLGGAIIDATAKQLAGNFFERLDKIAAAPAVPAIVPAAEPSAAGASAPRPGQPARSAPAAVAAPAAPVAWILAVVVAALAGFLIGRAQSGELVSVWAGLALGLLVVIVAAAGFEFGRRNTAPVVMLDAVLLRQLLAAAAEKNP